MKKNTAVLYYACSFIWFALSIMYYTSQDNSALGSTYLAIGAMWLCIGSALIVRKRKEEKTLQYYNENAASFTEGTFNADMSATRNKFLEYMPKQGMILDWGCGSGRDSVAFKELGYEIEAADASEELCKIASEKIGIEVRNESFDELEVTDKYDGIWACASLLHVEKEYLTEIFEKALKALKADGVMYVSFKYGDFEGERNGRYFTDLTDESFAKIIKGFKKFEIIEQWITEDVRPGREEEKWLNVILRKTSS